jgi:hypothetical protein
MEGQKSMPAIAPSLWRASHGLAALLLLGVSVAPAGAAVDFTFTTVKAIRLGSVGLDQVTVDCILTNTGTEPDEYDVFLAEDLQTTTLRWL